MPGHLGPAHSLESSCRWDERYKIGDKGAVYEFDIKMPTLSVDMTDQEFEDNAESSLDEFAIDLRNRYSWIGKIGRAGRSGGWLTIQDTKGLATESKLQNSTEMVSVAKRRFVRLLEQYYAPEKRHPRRRSR